LVERSRPRSARDAVAGLLVAVVLVVGLSGCSGGASARRFCDEVGRVPVISSADQLRGPGGQATLDDLRAALDRLRSRSPSDVRDDVATLSKVTGQLQEALRRQDEGDAAARDQARTQLDAGLSAFEDASTRVVDYTKRACGVDLSGTTAPTPAGEPGTPTGSGATTTRG
jgi:hypothetical protein